MLFHATVEETALKRRTSRLLLPLPVSQRKPKVRELALTSHRLLCLKPLKNGRGVGIKARFMLRTATEGQLTSSGREKRAAKGDEVRGTVTGVERKGAKEFVVLTVRFFCFLCVSVFVITRVTDVLLDVTTDGQVRLFRRRERGRGGRVDATHRRSVTPA